MILTSQIKQTVPFTLENDIPCEKVDAFLGDFEDYSAISPVKYSATLKRSKKGIHLDADISAQLQAPCQLCLDPVQTNVQVSCSLLLIDDEHAPKGDEICLNEEDLDTILYHEPNIDIEHIILETVFLELDPRVRCSQSCKGLCSQCGQNLNNNKCNCNEF